MVLQKADSSGIILLGNSGYAELDVKAFKQTN